MKQTCPKCGHNPAISLWQRCLMPLVGEKKQAHCCRCGTPLDNPAFCRNLQYGAAILSIFPAWILAPNKLTILVVFLLTLFLGGFIAAFLVPLVSILPEDQESIPAPEAAGMKAQLTCPKCGKAPVMGAMEKAFLFSRSVPRCPWCGTPLSNPSWFDIIRLLAMIGVPIASFILTRSKGLMILLFGVVLILTGLISLFCIPLQKHWNVTD